jgi:mono/diheme cytochrome c family protein
MTAPRLIVALCVALAFGATGCYQQMALQHKLKPQDPTDFWSDGRSTRPYVEGTVARGSIQEDGWYFTGKVKEAPSSPTTAPVSAEEVLGQYADGFPEPVTESTLKRGRERFNIYCNVCHGQTGAADGTIVMRGFLKPPAFWEQPEDKKAHHSRGLKYQGASDVALNDAPVGYLFHVITHGYGAMGTYSAQIPVADRWAIVAYIKALQETNRKGGVAANTVAAPATEGAR